jgi:SHS2 domain-containing protein
VPESRARGHRAVPHTADVRIEAWAPTREECIAEAVVAMVESFADTSGARVSAMVPFHVAEGPDEDMLVAVCDEVIYRLETAGEIPVDVEVGEAYDGGLLVRFGVTDATAVEPTGAAPKAVSLHDLRFTGADAEGWWCSLTLDV